MSYKITDTIIVDNNKNIGSIGTALFSGPVIIGGGTSTGTVSQSLQVTGSGTPGAYISGNVGIGSTNPTSKLWVSGDIYATGIVTAQVLNASKDPGTGIATDFTNSLFGNGWRVSSPGSTTYYKLATLPPGGGGNTFDHLIINGVLGAWTNGNQTPFEITFSNRGTFNYKYVSYGSVRSDVRIIGISTNSSVEIWAQHQASQFTKLVYNIPNSIESIVVSNPTSTTTAPTGTTVFDSSTATPRFIINESDYVGIGTATPQSALDVRGAITVGVGTVGINSVFSTTDIQSWSYTNKSKYVGADGDTSPQAIYVGASGTALFMLGSTGDDINRYTLSTPYDVSTAGAPVEVFSVATQETGPLGIDFNPTGTKMFISGTVAAQPGLIASGEYVHEYSLSTAWTVSTAGYTTSFNVTAQDTAPGGVTFGNSGSKMYVVGSTGDAVYQYSLSTPYSIASGVTYDNISLILGTDPVLLETGPTDISFNSTGTVLWIVGSTNDRIYEFRLGTAWDISTAVFYDDVYVGFNELVATGLQVIPEQNVAYIVGSGNDTIYQYSTNTPALKIASSGISSVSSIILNNETRVKDKLYVKGNTHVDGNILTQGTLTVDSTALVSSTLTASATVTFDTTTSNINFGTLQTTGSLILGGTLQTGSITLGRATTSQTTNIQAGVTASGNTKTINFGTLGASGSFTQINIGPTAGVGTVVINSGTNLLVGTTTSTGTASQLLQVNSGAYVSGSVGIGTTNPGATLNVVPTATSIAGLFSGTTSSDMVRITQLGTGNALVVEDSANPDSSPFVVKGDGSVGIGTNNPTVALQLSPNASISNVGSGITLAGTVGSALTVAQFLYLNNNTNYLRIKATRNATGGDWTTASTKLLTVTDVTEQGYIEYNPSGSTSGMAFGSGATEWARFTSVGNFGVGSTNPNVKFEVFGGTSRFAQSGQGDVSITHSSLVSSIRGASTIQLALGANNTDVIRINTSGLVGIGTTNPGATLNVVPTATSIAGLFSGTTSSDMVRITQLGTGNALVVEDETNPDATPFVVKADGSVGIGVTNPEKLLHLSSSVPTPLIIQRTTAGNSAIEYRNTTSSMWAGLPTNASGWGVGPTDNVGTGAQILVTRTGGELLVGRLTATGTASQLLQVDGGAYVSGNLGVANTNPSQTLHVQGNARVTGAVYDSTNSPGTSGQVLQSTVSGTQWTTAAAGGGGSGKFDTTIDNVLYVQPTGTLDIVGVGTTTSQITTLPAGSNKYLIHSLHVTNISNGDAEITAGFVMNARKVPATISVGGGAGINTITVGSASSIIVGMAVTGQGNIGETTGIGSTAGFQFNTYVTSVDGNNITLSKPIAGLSVSGTAWFSPVSKVSSRLPVPVGSAVELLKQPMVLNALDSIVLQSTGAGSGIGSTSTAAITQAANSNILTVTAGAAITNFLASGMLIQPTNSNTGIQTNTFVGVGYTPGALSIPMTRPATVALASTSLSFTEVVVPQDGALQVTVVYQSSTDTSYLNGTGTVSAAGTITSIPAGISSIPIAYYATGLTYPSIIQSIRVSNISDGIIYPGGDYPVSVGIGNSDTIFSWLAYNMVIPKNSSIELCESPKRLGIGQSIFATTNTPYAIEIQIAGKQKTS